MSHEFAAQIFLSGDFIRKVIFELLDFITA